MNVAISRRSSRHRRCRGLEYHRRGTLRFGAAIIVFGLSRWFWLSLVALLWLDVYMLFVFVVVLGAFGREMLRASLRPGVPPRQHL